MNRRAVLTGSAAAFALPGLALAQASTTAVAKANAGVVGIISGGLDGTYTRFAAESPDTVRAFAVIVPLLLLAKVTA